MVKSTDEIVKIAAEVRKNNLPQTMDSQRIFVNIENFRRIAEVIYKTNDTKEMRNLRIDSQALVLAASILDNQKYYEKTRQLDEMLGRLASKKNAVFEKGRYLQKIKNEYTNACQDGAALLPKEQQSPAFELYNATTMPLAIAAGVSDYYFPQIRLQRSTAIRSNEQLREIFIANGNRYPEMLEYAETMGISFEKYIETMDFMAETYETIKFEWEVIDELLKEMRDVVAMDAGQAIDSALASIGETAEVTRLTSFLIASGGAFILLFLLFLLHRYMVSPLHWASKKLADIQAGKMDDPMPVIRVKELYDIGLLLDRFSVHLSELYLHTSQLEEDAAEKRILKEVMETAFQLTLDGYCVWNLKHVIVANDKFHKLTRVSAKDHEKILLGDTPIEPGTGMVELYHRAIAKGFLRSEVYLTGPDGEKIPHELTRLPVVSDGETYILSYFRDLTEQKHREEELRDARDAAQEAAEAKSNFLARMSHEIRTPMNGVLGLTHLALLNNPKPEQKEYLEKIQASARILLRVINDILDFSKMDSGAFSLSKDNFAFTDMLSTVSDLLVAQAEKNGLYFRIEKDESIPPYLNGDEVRLSQILLNLGGNAVKFTEQGGVTLKIVKNEETANGVSLSFSITDTGIGLKEEEKAKLFKPFSQVDFSSTRKYGGTGLGLVISNMLVRMMGGEIAIDSTPGQGSTFYFTITLEKGQKKDTAPAPEQQASDDALKGLRILLAEDNEINQEIAVAILEGYGMTVYVANNGQEAVQLATQYAIDGILMDIEMPVMDGLAAAKKIRSLGDEKISNLPIIAMTAHALQENVDKSMEAKMNDHITKPINVNELKTKLHQWLVKK